MNLSRPVLINAKAMALSSHGFKAVLTLFDDLISISLISKVL